MQFSCFVYAAYNVIMTYNICIYTSFRYLEFLFGIWSVILLAVGIDRIEIVKIIYESYQMSLRRINILKYI